MQDNQRVGAFSMDAYANIIKSALDAGYEFNTLRQFTKDGYPKEKRFIIRHDIDKSPSMLRPIIDVEREYGVTSTNFVRVCGAEYNPFGYGTLSVLKYAEASGSEIGIHTACVEFAAFNGLDAIEVLRCEVVALRSFFKIFGVAPHRDINYVHNSLPFILENWNDIRINIGLLYSSYEDMLTRSTIYVNEGFDPHLCWRGITPLEAIKTGKSIYMLTHPHWWYKDHPHEAT